MANPIIDFNEQNPIRTDGELVAVTDASGGFVGRIFGGRSSLPITDADGDSFSSILVRIPYYTIQPGDVFYLGNESDFPTQYTALIDGYSQIFSSGSHSVKLSASISPGGLWFELKLQAITSFR
jgi:hypothetical protein